MKFKSYVNPVEEKFTRCDTCGKTFTTKTAVKLHIKHVHKTKPEEGNYCCVVCKMEFSSKTQLDNHGKKHIRKIKNIFS